MTKNKTKVAVGMSGGVDSSVAAFLLKQAGFEVIGIYLNLIPEEECDLACDFCLKNEAAMDAKKVADKIGIELEVLNIQEEFQKKVIDYFIETYSKLETPNPCVVCNKQIKFGTLLDFAKRIGCDYLATGHYVKVIEDPKKPNHYHLLKAKDESKDQSYFLYRLSQDQLKHIIFPLGKYKKEEVRKIAKENSLPVHEKKESQEICFIKDRDYRDFVKKYLPEKYFNSGEIVDVDGAVVGNHRGLINYTIGQRRRINQFFYTDQGDKKPKYVVGFDVDKNQLIVGDDKDLFKKEMLVKDLSWIGIKNGREVARTKNLKVKIRYRHKAVECRATIQKDVFLVKFKKPQRAITPGQSAVFYIEDEVIGGGIIAKK